MVLVPVVILLGIFAWLLVARTRPEPIKFVPATRQDIKTVVSAPGILIGEETVNLKFKTSGKLTYLKVRAGDEVKKGQVIARLDTQDLAIALQQALNTLRDKQAAAEKILDEVKGHDKDETFAQKATRTTAEVARDNAYDAVRAAQRSFQDAVIVSPTGGIVTGQPELIPGQFVGSGDLIAQVTNFSEKFFAADVDEADIANVKIGQKAEITLNSYGDKVFAGTVSKILPQTKTATSGATTVTVKIKMKDSQIEPIQGLNGQASIIISEAVNALIIPQEALLDDSHVQIASPRGLIEREISTGIKSDTDVEVKLGLTEGDKVVKNPQQVPRADPARNILRGVFRAPGLGR